MLDNKLINELLAEAKEKFARQAKDYELPEPLASVSLWRR